MVVGPICRSEDAHRHKVLLLRSLSDKGIVKSCKILNFSDCGVDRAISRGPTWR